MRSIISPISTPILSKDKDKKYILSSSLSDSELDTPINIKNNKSIFINFDLVGLKTPKRMIIVYYYILLF